MENITIADIIINSISLLITIGMGYVVYCQYQEMDYKYKKRKALKEKA